MKKAPPIGGAFAVLKKPCLLSLSGNDYTESGNGCGYNCEYNAGRLILVVRRLIGVAGYSCCCVSGSFGGIGLACLGSGFVALFQSLNRLVGKTYHIIIGKMLGVKGNKAVAYVHFNKLGGVTVDISHIVGFAVIGEVYVYTCSILRLNAVSVLILKGNAYE